MRRIALAGFVYAVVCAFGVHAQQPSEGAADGARYTEGNKLVRPSNYREWIFLGSGLDMTYSPPGRESGRHRFTNVYVNPSSYRAFMQTGAWVDGTIFALEIRNSGSESSINQAGWFQTGLSGLEWHVKDRRFPRGWAFFAAGAGDAWEPLSGDKVSTCVECHTKSGAVEETFVQFYPTLLDVAREKRTLRPGF